jgi:hypothetical protein
MCDVVIEPQDWLRAGYDVSALLLHPSILIQHAIHEYTHHLLDTCIYMPMDRSVTLRSISIIQSIPPQIVRQFNPTPIEIAIIGKDPQQYSTQVQFCHTIVSLCIVLGIVALATNYHPKV